MNNYFSLKVTTNVKGNIETKNVSDMIGRMVLEATARDKKLSEIHKGDGYKRYCFSPPFCGTGELSGVCEFEMRSLSKEIIDRFENAFWKYEDENFKTLGTKIKEYSFGRIKEIKTVTPAICTISQARREELGLESKYRNLFWTQELDVELLKQSIINNLVKKHENITGMRIDGSKFIKDISVTNKLAIGISYNKKGSKLLGNKFTITVGNGREAQLMARIAVAEGILEKSSVLGMGFTKATYEEVIL